MIDKNGKNFNHINNFNTKFTFQLRTDCIKLANKLIIELELDHRPIENLIEINGEFLWNIVLNLFDTDLLPKFKNLDCINETEEFQFILDTLQQIFDLDLKNINPAYLTRRKPEYVKLVLNALLLANYYIRKKSDTLNSKEIDDLLELSSSSSLSDLSNESSNEELIDGSNESSINLSDSSISEDFKRTDKSTANKNIKIKNSKTISKKDKMIESSTSVAVEKSLQNKKELTNEELDDKLKELDDNKKLIHNLTYLKEQNFALEISYKIMDVINIQKKSKEIKTNLNQLSANKPSSTRPKKSNKVPKKRPLKAKKGANNSKLSYQNLSDVMKTLTGLDNKQIQVLKEKEDYQKRLICKIRYDLVNVEKRLNSEMEAKIDKENKLLELLQKDFDSNLVIEERKSKLNDRRQMNKVKYDLYRERATFRKEVDKLYQTNLKDLKQLESEQEKRLRELTKKKDDLFKEDLNELRKEMKEYEMKKRNDQNLLFDNYDNLYRSQSNLIKQEIAKRKIHTDSIDHFNVSLNRHLEQTFKSKLYPKFI